MSELKYYEVEISGIMHVLKLTEADRDKRYPDAKQVDGPAKSTARAAAEKTANATADEVTVEKVVTSPAPSEPVEPSQVAEGTETGASDAVAVDEVTVETAPKRTTRAAAKKAS